MNYKAKAETLLRSLEEYRGGDLIIRYDNDIASVVSAFRDVAAEARREAIEEAAQLLEQTPFGPGSVVADVAAKRIRDLLPSRGGHASTHADSKPGGRDGGGM